MPHSIILFLLVLAGTMHAQDSRPVVDPKTALVPLITSYCADCHSGARAKSGVAFDRILEDVTKDTDVLGRAIEQLRAQSMPPAGRPAPDDDERREMIALFDRLLHPPTRPGAGRVVMRRLTREHFQITVKDVFGITYDATRTFPAEAPAYGFDAIGDVMTIAPLLFEKYFDAVQAIAARVVAEPDAKKTLLAPAGSETLDESALWRVLESLLARAFRRPPSDAEITSRVALFGRAKAEGKSDDEAIERVLDSIILSPFFLYRTEIGEAATEERGDRRLTAYELATRLSYFLTSGPPDSMLAAQARSGDLHDAAILASETRRLLRTTAPRRLADGFFAEWLRYREVLTAAADFRRYPQIWNDHLKPAMYEEAARFTADIVARDLDVRRLLDCDETFVDPPLAQQYGIPGVTGDGFRLVKLTDRRRGGIVTMGAVLMVTSYPLRTSPVLRGRWILDEILGDPPAAPPANVPPLPKDDQEKDGMTPRQRLERHRKDPSCAACHARIDPLGFALENYDVMGVWRDKVGDFPIDASGVLPTGEKIDGPIALKDVLKKRGVDFVRTMTEKMATCAVGRPFGAGDREEIERIAANVLRDDGRFSTMVTGIVTSRFFTHISRSEEKP